MISHFLLPAKAKAVLFSLLSLSFCLCLFPCLHDNSCERRGTATRVSFKLVTTYGGSKSVSVQAINAFSPNPIRPVGYLSASRLDIPLISVACQCQKAHHIRTATYSPTSPSRTEPNVEDDTGHPNPVVSTTERNWRKVIFGMSMSVAFVWAQ